MNIHVQEIRLRYSICVVRRICLFINILLSNGQAGPEKMVCTNWSITSTCLSPRAIGTGHPDSYSDKSFPKPLQTIASFISKLLAPHPPSAQVNPTSGHSLLPPTDTQGITSIQSNLSSLITDTSTGSNSYSTTLSISSQTPLSASGINSTSSVTILSSEMNSSDLKTPASPASSIARTTLQSPPLTDNVPVMTSFMPMSTISSATAPMSLNTTMPTLQSGVTHKSSRAGPIGGGVIGGILILLLVLLLVKFRKSLSKYFKGFRSQGVAPSAEFLEGSSQLLSIHSRPVIFHASTTHSLHHQRRISTYTRSKDMGSIQTEEAPYDEELPAFTKGAYGDPVVEKVKSAARQRAALIRADRTKFEDSGTRWSTEDVGGIA